jgi:hypothetical protein
MEKCKNEKIQKCKNEKNAKNDKKINNNLKE